MANFSVILLLFVVFSFAAKANTPELTSPCSNGVGVLAGPQHPVEDRVLLDKELATKLQAETPKLGAYSSFSVEMAPGRNLSVVADVKAPWLANAFTAYSK